MKIMMKAMNHIREHHPNANLVRAEYKDGMFQAVIFDDIGHINIKAEMVDNLIFISLEELKVDKT